jgi:hypothetical protein
MVSRGSSEDSPFLIKKETMIVKNKAPIDEVYKRDKKTIGKGTYGDVSICIHRDSG